MRTAVQYQHDVDGLNCEGIQTTGLSASDARQTLQKVVEIEEKLRQIDASLNLDLHALERQFQGRATSMQIQSANRSSHGREEEHRLDEEKRQKLAPYEDIKKRVDELLPKVVKMREDLEKAAA
jgi:predicted nuclease with TOPRIM domain